VVIPLFAIPLLGSVTLLYYPEMITMRRLQNFPNGFLFLWQECIARLIGE